MYCWELLALPSTTQFWISLSAATVALLGSSSTSGNPQLTATLKDFVRKLFGLRVGGDGQTDSDSPGQSAANMQDSLRQKFEEFEEKDKWGDEFNVSENDIMNV